MRLRYKLLPVALFSVATAIACHVAGNEVDCIPVGTTSNQSSPNCSGGQQYAGRIVSTTKRKTVKAAKSGTTTTTQGAKCTAQWSSTGTDCTGQNFSADPIEGEFNVTPSGDNCTTS